jgi:hypothetical protein
LCLTRELYLEIHVAGALPESSKTFSSSSVSFSPSQLVFKYGGNAARLRQDIALMRQRFPNLVATGKDLSAKEEKETAFFSL